MSWLLSLLGFYLVFDFDDIYTIQCCWAQSNIYSRTRRNLKNRQLSLSINYILWKKCCIKELWFNGGIKVFSKQFQVVKSLTVFIVKKFVNFTFIAFVTMRANTFYFCISDVPEMVKQHFTLFVDIKISWETYLQTPPFSQYVLLHKGPLLQSPPVYPSKQRQ